MLSQNLQNILPGISFYFDAAPLFVLLMAGLIIMVLGTFSSPLKTNKITFGIAICALITSLICACIPHPSASFFSERVLLDSISSISCFIISIGALFTLLCASVTKSGKNFLRSEITTLFLFSSAGLMIVTMSGDLLSFFVGLEITSLCLYVLVGYLNPHSESDLAQSTISQQKSLEASIKYFILGSGASAIILMGIALLYATLGNIYFQNFYNIDFKNPISLFGVVLFFSGLAFKLGIAPFHVWVPDVYEGANAHLTGYMASIVKFSLVMVFIRILSSLGQGASILQLFFSILGVCSIVIGALFGLTQPSVKRVLAYSSIANVGYFCLAFAALAKDPNSLTAKQSLFIYALIYVFLSLGAFQVIAWIKGNHRDDDLLIEELSGIGQSQPFPAFALSVFLFGLAGMPPLAGFFGKLVLIITAVQSGLTWFAITLVLFSCFSLYYYLNLMVEMWFKPPMRYTITASQPFYTNVVMRIMSTIVIIIVFGVGIFGI